MFIGVCVFRVRVCVQKCVRVQMGVSLCLESACVSVCACMCVRSKVCVRVYSKVCVCVRIYVLSRAYALVLWCSSV